MPSVTSQGGSLHGGSGAWGRHSMSRYTFPTCNTRHAVYTGLLDATAAQSASSREHEVCAPAAGAAAPPPALQNS